MTLPRQFLLASAALGLGYVLGVARHWDIGIAGSSSHEIPAEDVRSQLSAAPAREEVVSTVVTALLASDDLRELARISPLLATLDREQMRALTNQVDRMPQRDRSVLLPRLISFWTRSDPEGATEWMQPHLARCMRVPAFAGDGDSLLVQAWAGNAPELAFEYARQHAGTELATSILYAAILSWPGKDSIRAFEALMTYPPGNERENVLRSFCYTWAQSDPDVGITTVAALPPGPEREDALGEILAYLAQKDPAAAFEKAATHDLQSSSWMAILVKQAALKDPATAIAWLEKQDPEFVAHIGPITVQLWAKTDPAAAFAWAQEHAISLTEVGVRRAQQMPGRPFEGAHGIEIGFQSPFAAAMRARPDAALAWVRALPPGPERDRYLELAIRDSRDVEKVKRLFHELSAEAADSAAAMIAGELTRIGPDESRQWAESLPPGSSRDAAWTALGANRTEPLELPPGRDRDAMLSGMAGSLSQSTPVKALERVVEIGDPQLRRRTFDDVMWRLTRGRIYYGPTAYTPGVSEATLQRVREWLSGSDIPAEWRNAWPQ